MPKEKRKCLIDGCKNKFYYSRGLCISHYAMILRLVRSKKRKWEEFEKVGMAIPSKSIESRTILNEMLVKKGLKI